MDGGRMYGDTDSSSSRSFDLNSWNRERQVNLELIMNSLKPLGLKLTETPALLEKVDQLTFEQDPENYNNAIAIASQPKDATSTNKMKAENFPIRSIRIGTWQRGTVNEGDLVAKCYFAKRKLVWEFLEYGLKKKIEIPWGDILSFQATCRKDRTALLDIELVKPPSFHLERQPQPRKHTQWTSVLDFTEGNQATRYRIHHLEFPSAALERTLDKLVTSDEHWAKLSQKGFPSLESPHFPTEHDFSWNSGGHGSAYIGSNIQQQPLSANVLPAAAATSLLAHYPTYEHTPQQSLGIKDSDSPFSDEPISNRATLGWAQGLNNVIDSTLTTNSVGGIGCAGFAATATSPAQVNTNSVGGIGFAGFAAASSSAQVNMNPVGGVKFSPFAAARLNALQSQNYLGTYAQEVDRDHLGGIISTPSNSQMQMQMQMHPRQQVLSAPQGPTMHLQQPMYDQKEVNSIQNIGLSNLHIGNHYGVAAEGDLYREGNATSSNIDEVTDFERRMIDSNSLVMNDSNFWANNGGSTLDFPALADSLLQVQAYLDVSPANCSPVFSDPRADFSAKTFGGINDDLLTRPGSE